MSTMLRTKRATRGTSGIAIAMITFSRLALVTATRVIARRIAGIAIKPSMIRIRTASKGRLYPEIKPITRPTRVADTATPKPTVKEIRPP